MKSTQNTPQPNFRKMTKAQLIKWLAMPELADGPTTKLGLVELAEEIAAAEAKPTKSAAKRKPAPSAKLTTAQRNKLVDAAYAAGQFESADFAETFPCVACGFEIKTSAFPTKTSGDTSVRKTYCRSCRSAGAHYTE